MLWSIARDGEHEVVRVTTSGSLTRLDENLAMSQAIVTEAQRLNITRILVDQRALTFALRIVEIAQVPQKLIAIGLQAPYRVAILMPPPSPADQDFHFLEMVAAREGLLTKNFRAPEDAMAWLLAG